MVMASFSSHAVAVFGGAIAGALIAANWDLIKLAVSFVGGKLRRKLEG